MKTQYVKSILPQNQYDVSRELIPKKMSSGKSDILVKKLENVKVQIMFFFVSWNVNR